MQKRIFWSEFFFLWIGGITLTALTLFLADFPPAALALQLLFPFQSQSTAIMLAALVAQSAVQMAVATGVGLWAAHQFGMGAPVLETWFRSKPQKRVALPPLLPIIVIAIAVAMIGRLPDLSIFNPNRKQRAAEVTEIVQSPVGAKLGDMAGERVARRRFTPFLETVSFLDDAINGEIYARLFMISVLVLLLSRLSRQRGTVPSDNIVWSAILVTILIRAVYLLTLERTSAQMYSSLLNGIHLTQDPFWLIAVRRVFGIVPSYLGFGWLYIKYGIESSILAHFITAVAGSLFLNFVLIHSL
jgi:hypothetical protein